MLDQILWQRSLFSYLTRRSKCSNAQQLETTRDHLPLSQVAINKINCDVYCDSLNFYISLDRKKPIDKVCSIFLVHSTLLRYVIEARIVLHFFISNLIVKLLNIFTRVEFVWFRPEEKLRLVDDVLR
jgi:hypothetical protein